MLPAAVDLATTAAHAGEPPSGSSGTRTSVPAASTPASAIAVEHSPATETAPTINLRRRGKKRLMSPLPPIEVDAMPTGNPASDRPNHVKGTERPLAARVHYAPWRGARLLPRRSGRTPETTMRSSARASVAREGSRSDLKTTQPLRHLLFDLNDGDLGPSGPSLAPANHPLDGGRVSLEDSLDRPVRIVTHPAAHRVRPRGRRRRIAVPDALDEPANDDTPPDHAAKHACQR